MATCRSFSLDPILTFATSIHSCPGHGSNTYSSLISALLLHRNQLAAPGEAGREVMKGVGVGPGLPPPPPMPAGHTAISARPGPALTEKQAKKLLKVQKRAAKYAKKEAKKVFFSHVNYARKSAEVVFIDLENCLLAELLV